MALVRVHHHVRRDVVQTEGPVVAAGEQLRRRQKVHRVHGGGVRLHLAKHRLGLHVEQLHVPLLVSRSEQFPVLAEVA